MQYYKWMHEDDQEIYRIPGFVFMNLEDAINFSEDFEDWCYSNNNQKSKNLYTFIGVDPTPIKQILTSHFGFPTKPRKIPHIPNIKKALAYFDTKDVDHFTYADSANDELIMLAIAKQLGCVAYGGQKNKWVSTREALYMQPITMTKISPQTLIAMTQDDEP